MVKELTQLERIEFLELVAKMASHKTFERKLGLNPSEIEYYRKEFDIESSQEARRLARSLKRSYTESREESVLAEIQKVREAERLAQARLEALEVKKQEAESEKASAVDVNKIRAEDAERQRRYAEQLEEASVKVTKPWRLTIEPNAGSEPEQIERFRRSIVSRGLNFTAKQYNATKQQIKNEAKRLGLKINWDTVRR